MPICSFTRTSKYGAYLLWRIDESEEMLIQNSTADILVQLTYRKLTHPRRKREWLAARLALQQLLNKLGHTYTSLKQEAGGRPYLVDSTMHVGISHCSSFALVAIDRQAPIGVDIQLPSKKLQTVKSKFLNRKESQDSGYDTEKLCLYWCAKEVIYKAHGVSSLSLKQDIHIHKFAKNNQSAIYGKVNDTSFIVHYNFYHGHVVAWGKRLHC